MIMIIAFIFSLMDEASVPVRPLEVRTVYIQENVWLTKYDE